MPKVLFIEDDAAIVRALTEAAQNAGWTPKSVQGNDIKRGRAADIATAEEFDAIVVGGYFLEADIPYGHTIVGQICKRHCSAIIIGTAGNPKSEAEFLKAGADAFVCRGSAIVCNPAGGFTKALELIHQGFESPRRSRMKKKSPPKPTPDQT